MYYKKHHLHTKTGWLKDVEGLTPFCGSIGTQFFDTSAKLRGTQLTWDVLSGGLWIASPLTGHGWFTQTIEFRPISNRTGQKNGEPLLPTPLLTSNLDLRNLRPTGKGKKASLAGSLAWKHNDAENADAAEFAADMPTMSAGGIEPRPNCLWTSQPGGEGRGS